MSEYAITLEALKWLAIPSLIGILIICCDAVLDRWQD